MKNLLNKIKKINYCNVSEFVPFYIEDDQLGKIHKSNVGFLDPGLFIVTDYKILLNPALKTTEERTKKMHEFNLHLKHSGVIKRWRDEPYIVSRSYGEPIIMFIEREATEFYGTMKYGVHLNGYTIVDGQAKMWVQKRAMNKSVDPGKFDCLVSGGYNASQNAIDKIIEECYDESNIKKELAEKIKPVSLISYGMQQGTFFRRSTAFVFDLELPMGFVPKSNDGEVESFCLFDYEQIIHMINNTQDLKDNCDLIITDFMIRHGVIMSDKPYYVEVVKSLRQ